MGAFKDAGLRARSFRATTCHKMMMMTPTRRNETRLAVARAQKHLGPTRNPKNVGVMNDVSAGAQGQGPAKLCR